MGNSREDAATPFSAIFFKTVLVAGLTGIVVAVALHVVRWTQGGVLDRGAWPLVLLAGASLGGVLGAASGALSLGFHRLARNLPKTLQPVAAAVGGALGVAAPPLLVLGPKVLTGTPVALLICCVLGGAAWAVVVTRPLRSQGYRGHRASAPGVCRFDNPSLPEGGLRE